jgi:hypothetical protein
MGKRYSILENRDWEARFGNWERGKENVRGAECGVRGEENVRGAECGVRGEENVRGAECGVRGEENVRGASVNIPFLVPVESRQNQAFCAAN